MCCVSGSGDVQSDINIKLQSVYPSFVVINTSGHSTCSFYTGLLSVRYFLSSLIINTIIINS